jgi:hypothetical protein
MATSNLKTKYLLLLPEPFTLEIPYADRQRVVIVADEHVEAERRARKRSRDHDPTSLEGPAYEGVTASSAGPTMSPLLDREAMLGSADIEPGGDEPPAAALGRQLIRGLQEINRDLGSELRRDFRDVRSAGTDFKRKLDDRTARRALRRHFGALMVGRSEAGVLRLDQGHPLNNFLYVGHPAKRDLYFPAAEFHRRVFEHKFVEAVTLLTSLGANRIVVEQEQGHVQEKERSSIASGLGFSRARSEQSRSGALFEAEFPGHGEPKVPGGLSWYPDEQTWQMIANARIESGAQRTSLAVTYTTDYGIDTHMMRTAKNCGISIGGRFEEQRDTIWRLDAEFPSLAR